MKRIQSALALVLLLACPSMPAIAATEANLSATAAGPADQAGAQALAAQVREIAHTRLMSRAKKEKRIATTVRVAVVAATAYKSPAEALGIASEMAASAAAAAPQFKDVIANAVSFIPAIARIDGAAGQIRAAVDDATTKAAAGEKTAEASAVAEAEKPTAEIPPAPPPAGAPVQTAGAEMVAERERQATPGENPPAAGSVAAPGAQRQTGAETTETETASGHRAWWTIPEIPVGDNASLHFIADVSGRYDDNIFLTKIDKVGDEILDLTPGAQFQYGQNSLTSGSLTYQETFERYLRTDTANARLGTGNANFNYDDSNLTANGTASFQQLNQNNRDVVIQGLKAIIRQDVLNLGGNVEPHFTAKTSVGAGADYSRTHFRTAGLIDSSSLGLPVTLYYAATPKVDLSLGTTYTDVKVQGAAHDSRYLYYNVGARGDFTPKLSGRFSMGYKTRDFEQTRNNSTFGFDGTFNYEVTAKTSSSLTMTRDFNVGALGESLTTTRFALNLSTAVSPQWQINGGVSYEDAEYSTFRTDDYWEGSVSATYIYSNRLSATAGYTLRNNQSTLSGAEFSDDIVTLTLSYRS